MHLLRSFGTHVFVAVLASALTMLIGLATFAGATDHTVLQGSIYSQTCTVNARVSECRAGQGCREVKDPVGHVANGRGTELVCQYP
jgi:hypothetical protein